MSRRIPQDHNYRTPCPPAIKAKITALENAAMDYAFAGSMRAEDADRVEQDAQWRRYCLERTITTHVEVAVKAALEAAAKTCALSAQDLAEGDWGAEGRDMADMLARRIRALDPAAIGKETNDE